MTLKRPPIRFAAGGAVLLLAALAVAGCGGGGSKNSSSDSSKAASGNAATVDVSNLSLGNVLVDRQGRTLYLFSRDTATKSACSGACADHWPPLQASGKPTVGDGATASMTSTLTRSDGAKQVTYNGHPLYRFEGDKNAGDTNGEGITAFGGTWYAVSPSGGRVSPAANSGGGGGGY